VIAKGASGGMKYIKSVTLDGSPLRTFVLRYDDIKDGADLVFEMSDVPQSWPLE
jgi:putative alpha-1,2-mannosidase